MKNETNELLIKLVKSHIDSCITAIYWINRNLSESLPTDYFNNQKAKLKRITEREQKLIKALEELEK